jgi:hypothetical protein
LLKSALTGSIDDSDAEDTLIESLFFTLLKPVMWTIVIVSASVRAATTKELDMLSKF